MAWPAPPGALPVADLGIAWPREEARSLAIGDVLGAFRDLAPVWKLLANAGVKPAPAGCLAGRLLGGRRWRRRRGRGRGASWARFSSRAACRTASMSSSCSLRSAS